jgi:hypothetical protein
MELLNICCPLHMALLLNLALQIDEDHGVPICMKKCFFVENIMDSLLQCMYQTIEIIVICVLINFGLCKSF